jgi:hypothetical protein
MTEKTIERYLIRRVKQAGGLTYKLYDTIGIPDRIVITKQGRVQFIELKATGKKTRISQDKMIEKLQKFHQEVYVIDGTQKIDELVQKWS